VLLDRELDDGVRAIVQQAFEPPKPLLGVTPDAVVELDVLALDDGPHQITSRGPRHPGAFRGSSAGNASMSGSPSSVRVRV
jgi:hypothetical protein